LTNPPPSLLGPNSTKLHPSITAYTGPDVPQILQAVQNRPRSHSNAGLTHHSRKGSLAGSGSGSNLLSGSIGGGGPPTSSSAPPATHHSRTASWGRNSLDRRAAKDLIDPSASSGSMTASGLPSNPFSTSGVDGRASPEAFSQGHGGIVAGDTPRRIGSNGIHRRSGEHRFSRRVFDFELWRLELTILACVYDWCTGSESASNRVAGSTIRE
jgi:hypothetical protein